MTKLLNEDEVATYRARGYHFPVNALSENEVAEFRGKLEDYEARIGGPIQGEMRHRSHVLFPWINEMIRHPKILDAIEDLLGPDILCWNTSFFIKEPHDPGFVSWHQDATYWGLDSSDVATAWIAMATPMLRHYRRTPAEPIIVQPVPPLPAPAIEGHETDSTAAAPIAVHRPHRSSHSP